MVILLYGEFIQQWVTLYSKHRAEHNTSVNSVTGMEMWYYLLYGVELNLTNLQPQRIRAKIPSAEVCFNE